MFPLRDHNPSRRTPFVTWALMAANIAVFLMYFPQSSGNPVLLASFFDDWAFVPAELARGIDSHTLITSMFLHGGWWHLLGNMWFLFIFGDNVEDLLGHVRYLLFYLAAGVCAALAQMMADPGSFIPMVGASGAIAGVMGGYLLMYPRARIDVLIFFWITAFPAWLVLAAWLAYQLLSGATTPGDAGGVAYWAHAGGFLAGLILLLPTLLRRGGPGFWSRTDGAPPNAETHQTIRGSGDPFADGPIRSTRYERAPIRSAGLSQSRIPRAGRTAAKPPPAPKGPWG